MSDSRNIDAVSKQFEEMKGLFEIGVEIIPFLSEMFRFLIDTMPLMLEVNSSLEDGTHTIPTASERIISANHATELATHQILNKLDSITHKVNDLSQNVTNDQKRVLEQIQDEVADITSSLQFQDITSQNLDHANRILSAIHSKFVPMFIAMEQVKTNTSLGLKIMDVMNNKAVHDNAKDDDIVLEDKTADTIRQEGISQDDIDKLFSK